VRAQTSVRVLAFDGACLLRRMEADPALGYAILTRFVPVIAHRLSSARLQLLDLYGPAMAPAKHKSDKVKVEKAVKNSKGRNRSAIAAVDAVIAQAAADKAGLKLVKQAAKAKEAGKGKSASKKGK
jgi:CRP-like cAMP-binding protein